MKWNHALLSGFMMASILSAPISAAPVFAAEDTGSITLDFNDKDNQKESQFMIYQLAVLKNGNYVPTAEFEKITSIKWEFMNTQTDLNTFAKDYTELLNKRIDDDLKKAEADREFKPYSAQTQNSAADPMVFKELPQGLYLVKQNKKGASAGTMGSFIASINPGHMEVKSSTKVSMPGGGGGETPPGGGGETPPGGGGETPPGGGTTPPGGGTTPPGGGTTPPGGGTTPPGGDNNGGGGGNGDNSGGGGGNGDNNGGGGGNGGNTDNPGGSTNTPGLPQNGNPPGNTTTTTTNTTHTITNEINETNKTNTTTETNTTTRVPGDTDNPGMPQSNISRTPSSTDDSALPQSSIPNTGMNLWKVPYLALAGLLSMTAGWLMIGKKKEV